MPTIARQFVDELQRIRKDVRRAGLMTVLRQFSAMEISREDHDGISIAWYRDGSATSLNHDIGADDLIEVWMDEDSDGYEESKRYFETL